MGLDAPPASRSYLLLPLLVLGALENSWQLSGSLVTPAFAPAGLVCRLSAHSSSSPVKVALWKGPFPRSQHIPVKVSTHHVKVPQFGQFGKAERLLLVNGL